MRGWSDREADDLRLREAADEWEQRRNEPAPFADESHWAPFHLVGLP